MRKIDSLLNRIASHVKHSPGKTGAELSKIMQSPGAYRRLSEVSKLGLAKKGNRRKCEVSGKMADTWYPDDRPEEPDRGQISHRQEVMRLQDRIKFLETENHKLTTLLEHERRVRAKLEL